MPARIWIGDDDEITDSVEEFWTVYAQMVSKGKLPYIHIYHFPPSEVLGGTNSLWEPGASILDEHFPDGWHVWMEENRMTEVNDPQGTRARLETVSGIKVTAYGYPPVEAFRGLLRALDLSATIPPA